MIATVEGFGVILTVAAVGWILARFRVLLESDQRVLAMLVYFVAAPALIIDLLAVTDVTVVFGAWFGVALIAAVSTIMVYVPFAVRRRRSRQQVVVGSLSASYGNLGFVGLPVAAFVLGDATYVLPMLMLQLLILAPVGLSLLNPTGVRFGPLGFFLAGVRNPMTIAATIGVGLSTTGFTLPAVLAEPISMIGAMAVPVALIAFGASLRFGPKIGAETRADVLVVVLLKMAWQPTVAWVTAAHLFGLPPAEVAGVTMMAALPTAQNVFIYATRFGQEVPLARDSIATSVLASIPALMLVSTLLL